MKITASLTLTSDGIALDHGDHDCALVVERAPDFSLHAVTLTRDEAAELRDELDRAIGGTLAKVTETIAGPCAEVDASGMAWTMQTYSTTLAGPLVFFSGPGGGAWFRASESRPWTVNLYTGMGFGATLAEALADVVARRAPDAPPPTT